MNLRQIKSIIKEFESSKVYKLELSNESFNLKLEKAVKANNNIISSFDSMASEAATTNQVVAAMPQEDKKDTVDVTAPLVGTFYDSPSPESAPFVSLNQQVSKGETLCIVEAMKVMNEITAPIDGTIAKINVKSGTMVQFGETLLEIKP